jgi:hypothetical protein
MPQAATVHPRRCPTFHLGFAVQVLPRHEVNGMEAASCSTPSEHEHRQLPEDDAGGLLT